MIQITDLNKKFGKLEVLKNVNLNCNKGECIALIGPNGCGKTTLIKSILGMVLPDKGEITFNEKPIKNEYLYREKIGYMPQIGRYPDNMTIGHVIEMIKQIRNTNQELDEDLLKAFELEKMFDKQMRTLSGGTTQKVSATLAFLFNPDVLILDEPVTGLDPAASMELYETIKDLNKKENVTIIMVSHDIKNALNYATHILHLEQENDFFGTVEEYKKSNVSNMFLGGAAND